MQNEIKELTGLVAELMKDNDFLNKKVEILEQALKQTAVIQYELDKKLGELEGLE